MKPGFQRVRTRSKPGFMSSRLARGAQIAVLAVLAVPVLPELGSPYPAATTSKRHWVDAGSMFHRPGSGGGAAVDGPTPLGLPAALSAHQSLSAHPSQISPSVTLHRPSATTAM